MAWHALISGQCLIAIGSRGHAIVAKERRKDGGWRGKEDGGGLVASTAAAAAASAATGIGPRNNCDIDARIGCHDDGLGRMKMA